MDTHVKHEHATGGYGQRRAECEQGAAQLKVGSLREVGLDDLPAAQGVLNEVVFRRVRHIVTENQRVLDVVELLGTQGPASIGPVLDASHASMRDDFEISVPELDLAVEVARANGALGARMTGGGFGGSAIALVPQDRADAIGAAVVEAFSEAGYAQPGLFVVHPVAGACPLG